MFSRAALAAALVALVAHSAAAPAVEIEGTSAGFTVEQVASDEKVLISGPVEVAKTYRKFNKPVPANVASAAAAATTSGSVVASPQSYDSEYLIPVTIGGQSLTLDLDTGSSDLWVFSTLQPSSQTKGHKIYNYDTGSYDYGEYWQISYGDGSGADGYVFFDKVTIGGVTATSQAVEAAESASSSFVQNTAVSGLAGFAFPNINTCQPTKCTPWFQTIMSQLPSKVFTSSLKKGKAGSYDFGYIASSKYTGSIAYATVTTKNGFWEFTATGYAVGSTTYSLSLDTIMDTGTTLVYMPSAVVTNYYAKVSGATNSRAAGGYIFPCSATLPSLSFTIGGASHTIPGTYLNYAPYSGSSCFGGLQSSAGIGINILGDIFIKSQFVVFDVGNTRIGVATPSSL